MFQRGNLVMLPPSVSINYDGASSSVEVRTDPLNWDELSEYVKWLSQQYPEPRYMSRSINEPANSFVSLDIRFIPGEELGLNIEFTTDTIWASTPYVHWQNVLAEALGFKESA